ncbi:hypothetical protein [Curtobacterium sp. NPDC086286]|uniref:hypothetical protein n=1 Tax=Curtobacterium sp. NPDC086286 TaxID=3363964 RepID=UPI003820CB99
MRREANVAQQPGGGMQGAGMFFLALGIFAVVGTFWVAMTLGSKLAGVNTNLPLDPFAVVGGTIKGRYTWTMASTWVAIGIGAVVLALVFLYLVQGARARAKRTPVDWAARYMGRGHTLDALSEKGASATAQRLGVTGWIDSPIGTTVLGLRKLYALRGGHAGDDRRPPRRQVDQHRHPRDRRSARGGHDDLEQARRARRDPRRPPHAHSDEPGRAVRHGDVLGGRRRDAALRSAAAMDVPGPATPLVARASTTSGRGRPDSSPWCFVDLAREVDCGVAMARCDPSSTLYEAEEGWPLAADALDQED